MTQKANLIVSFERKHSSRTKKGAASKTFSWTPNRSLASKVSFSLFGTTISFLINRHHWPCGVAAALCEFAFLAPAHFTLLRLGPSPEGILALSQPSSFHSRMYLEAGLHAGRVQLMGIFNTRTKLRTDHHVPCQNLAVVGHNSKLLVG